MNYGRRCISLSWPRLAVHWYGKLLAERFPEARRTFEEADQVLGFFLSLLCFEGPDEALKQTENTQPALLAVSVAAWRVLAARGFQARFVAGHSLGEYSALVAAGALTFPDALRLVRKRGRYMQEAVPEGVGAMAALLKLPPDRLEGVLSQAAEDEIVTAANYNSPDQVVIAGHAGAVDRASVLAKEAGAKRAVRLQVSAPFHCPLMRPAQENLAPDLTATPFNDLSAPLVNNWQARTVTTGREAREGLYQQVPNPVRWTEIISCMIGSGVGRFVEVGSGSVLLGLLRSINPEVRGVKFGEPVDMDKVEALLA